MNKLYIFHISDTHYAAQGEALNAVQIAASAALSGVAGSFTYGLRQIVLANRRAGHHRAALRGNLHNFLRIHVPLLMATGVPVLLLHTGDLTQGGQPRSLEHELRDLATLCPQFKAIPGNHDLWPADFPIFSAHLTHVQFQRVRNTLLLPSVFPELVQYPLPRGDVRLWLLNSALSDSWPNSRAVGKVEREHIGGGWHEQIDAITQAPATRLKIVALHHPVAPLDGWVAGAISTVTGPVIRELVDAQQTQAELLHANVGLVLCGHEHQGSAPDEAILADGRLLQLAVGSPTLRGSGKRAPQLSLYCVNLEGSNVELTWATYYLDQLRWSLEATFEYDGSVWSRWPNPDSGAIPSLGLKPSAPFP